MTSFGVSGNIWNPRKPVWFQAIVQLVEPHLMPVVHELMEMVQSGKAWTMNHVPGTIKEIIGTGPDI